MLAAIKTTILSSRSWALTCSAMVSRSRLNRTRGPPDALRMVLGPPPQYQLGRSPRLGVKLKKNNNFIHSAPSRALYVRAESGGSNCGTAYGSPSCRPYSELGLVLPSKTPASGRDALDIPNAAQAKRAIQTAWLAIRSCAKRKR